MKFGYYDSCLFLSICMADEGGADLKGMIAFIDYADHSIINWKELRSGLVRLKVIGAVNETDKKVFLAKPFKAWWQKVFRNSQRKTISKQVEEITEYLNTTYSTIGASRRISRTKFTEAAFIKALKEYGK